ncbi:MAG TPA: hypothetical protein VFV38_15120 [Ktedonobacteraceae bacterium]|nr:hypothetical protein [Ktedonobacteraceae bacterium]
MAVDARHLIYGFVEAVRSGHAAFIAEGEVPCSAANLLAQGSTAD